MDIRQKIARLERQLNQIKCCSSPGGGSTFIGTIQFLVGSAGDAPASSDVVFDISIADTGNVLGATQVDDHDYTVHLNGEGYLVPNIDYTIVGNTITLLGGRQFQDKELWTIFLYN